MNKKSWFKKLRIGISEVKKTEKGKAILFFCFYFIFFVILFLFIYVGGSSTTKKDDYELNSLSTYSVDKILNANYDFVYTINIDDNTFIYRGERINDVESFTFNDVYYYRNSDHYFMNSNGIFIATDSPYMYTEFLDFSRLGEVIVDATYISKTEFDNGVTLFNYQISSNSLIKRIENVDTDILEVPNQVMFTASSDGEVYKAQLDLTSYGKYKEICNHHFSIVLEYSDFLNNKEIVNPLI